MRVDKENYYLDIAETVLERGTCLRRNYGAIIVKNDEIVSTGYSGAPRGRKNCINLGYCMRESLNIPQGERYELCRSVHAEANAIISASRRDMLGATLYLAGRDMKTVSYTHLDVYQRQGPWSAHGRRPPWSEGLPPALPKWDRRPWPCGPDAPSRSRA